MCYYVSTCNGYEWIIAENEIMSAASYLEFSRDPKAVSTRIESTRRDTFSMRRSSSCIVRFKAIVKNILQINELDKGTNVHV